MVKWMLCSLHLCLVIFHIPCYPSQHLHCQHLNFSLYSSRHSTCTHVASFLLSRQCYPIFSSFFSGQCSCCSQCHFNSLSLCINKESAGSFLTLPSCRHNRRREREKERATERQENIRNNWDGTFKTTFKYRLQCGDDDDTEQYLFG